MIAQLIAHLFGDYVLQTSWMAETKTKRWLPAILHAAIYTACFVFLTRSIPALLVIGVTHLFIDRYRLVNWWIRVKGDYSPSAPFWLMVIQDNSFHLLINYLALAHLT